MSASLRTLVAVGTVAVAGCGGASASSYSAGASGTTPASAPAVQKPAAAAATGSLVKLANSRYGKILVDGRGHTLYLFTRDLRSRSRCYGACARTWPVLVTRGTPRAGRGVRQSLLSSTKRSDGRRQVTYRGHPLYRYVGETRAGQILCQNVLEYGGYWLIVSPSGKAIR